MLTCHDPVVVVTSGLALALGRLEQHRLHRLGVAGGGGGTTKEADLFLVAAAVRGAGGDAAALLVVVALAGLVVLEPVEDVLALHLAEGAEVGGDPLDLLRGRRPQARPEQLRQHLHLLSRRVPPPALHAHPPAQHLHRHHLSTYASCTLRPITLVCIRSVERLASSSQLSMI